MRWRAALLGRPHEQLSSEQPNEKSPDQSRPALADAKSCERFSRPSVARDFPDAKLSRHAGQYHSGEWFARAHASQELVAAGPVVASTAPELDAGAELLDRKRHFSFCALMNSR
jgi:hypothetical protein